jgi:uncharacterized iron-regulated protein
MRIASLLPLCLLAACAGRPPHCAAPRHWADPATLRIVADPTAHLAGNGVVLLGEQHDSAADHDWELATIQRIYAADPSMVLGFEMFPRTAQPVLDAWTDGRLSDAEFLARTDWQHVWGFPPEFYMPIFRFARDHRVPMRALNVSHHLVHLVGQSGWAGVVLADREGVGTPAPPSADYRHELADVMSGHGGPAMSPERLGHFIDAQLLWDRAMAEAVASQRAAAPGRPVVALMGAGHLENRDGVPHQLEAMGVAHPLVLIPVDEACDPPGRDYADAIYTVAPPKPPGPAITAPAAPRS